VDSYVQLFIFRSPPPHDDQYNYSSRLVLRSNKSPQCMWPGFLSLFQLPELLIPDQDFGLSKIILLSFAGIYVPDSFLLPGRFFLIRPLHSIFLSSPFLL